MALIRTLASFVPSQALLGVRRISDLAGRLSDRPHEADFLAFRSFRIHRPSVIDVGANRGQSIESFMRVIEAPQIVAFEPNHQLAAYLTNRYEKLGVIVHQSGLGASSETLHLYLPKYGKTVWDTRASLDESTARESLRPHDFWRFRQARATVLEMDVDIRPLDDFGLSPDILKIDVEGTEDAVIEGGLATIRQHRPVILAEGMLGASGSDLTSIGYTPHRYDDARAGFVSGESGTQNTFYLCYEHYPMFDVPIV